MSAALVIDIHSAAFWAWVDFAHPGSVAATLDGNGMAAVHTAGPLYFEKAGKWIPHPQGVRTNLSLTQVGDRRDGLMAWHPDTYKARLGQAQAAEFGLANREGRCPLPVTKVPNAPDPLPFGSVPITVTHLPPAIPASALVIGGAVVTNSTIPAPDLVTNSTSSELTAVRDALRDLLTRVEGLIAKG